MAIVTGFLAFAAGFGSGLLGTGLAGVSLGPSAWLAGSAIGAKIGIGLGGLGSFVLSTALQFGANALLGALDKPKAEGVQGNVSDSTPYRRMLVGTLLIGGNLVFSESKAAAVFYAVHHGDSECVETVAHWLLDTPVTLDENLYVSTPPFQLGPGKYFRIEGKPGTADQTVSTLLNDMFPEWDADHVGAGCCYTVVRGDAIAAKDRPTVYKHRGPLGTGEPSYLREGNFSRCYDPRDEEQDIDDPSTWGWTKNAALVIAMFRTHADGFGKPMASVNWDRIGEAADICDEIVTGRDGIEVPRWAISTVIPFNEPRMDVERRMLEACDGMRFFDEDGKWFIRVGGWEAPTKSLGRRDVISVRVVPNADGESDFVGWTAQYTDPNLAYSTQVSAAWQHPDFFVDGAANRIAQLEVPEADSHNQAVRVCKAVGLRSRAARRIEGVFGIGALKLRPERFVTLALDDAWLDGDYEILGYEEAPDGMSVSLVLVESADGNWDLEAGEEGPLPTYDNALTLDSTVPVPTGFDAQAVAVAVSGGFAVQLQAVFDPPDNPSHVVTVEWKLTSGSVWTEMVSVSDQGRAYADQVAEDGESYDVRAFTETSGGSVSGYTATETLVATADSTAPGALTSVSVGSGLLGHATWGFTTPASANIATVAIWRSANDTLDRATDTLVARIPVLMSTAYAGVDGDDGVTTLVVNGDYSVDANWTKGTWGIAAGVATHPPGVNDRIYQALSYSNGDVVRIAFTVTARVAGDVRARLEGSTGGTVAGTARTATGTFVDSLTAAGLSGTNRLGFVGSATFDGSIDDAKAYVQTVDCAPQGTWHYFLEAENGSGVPGPTSGPHASLII